MRTYKLLLLLTVLGLVWSTPAAAQTSGSCSLGSATKDLDVNNVRARLFNVGGLFWKGAGNVYNVPKTPEGQPITPNAIFASGIWLGGLVNGQLRSAASTYSDWEFWPGPLDENGELPGNGDCSQYDRIWKVSREDISNLDASGVSTNDIDEWPADLGAPFIDADGDGVYNVASGDRPDILGDEMAWWIMNDVGNTHATTGTSPMGLEVRVSAFAFNLAGDIGNTTFYKYNMVYKGKAPMTDAWFGIWTDPDLGNATDDYVGSDTTLGVGYVYNADNDDEGSDGYGTAPPALGYDFFQGPLVDAPGESHTDPDGTVYTDQKRLSMTRFLFYNNDTSDFGNPRDLTSDYYNYLRGIWQDGSRMCFGGNGFKPTGCAQTTDFMWPGDPATGGFWSEFNIDGAGTANPPSDRRFLMSTGPFTLNPGDKQTLVYGIVTGFGADNLDSVNKMKSADALAQAAFDADFQIPPPPNAPRVTTSELDETVILKWENLPTDNNYLEGYTAFNPFAFDPNDAIYHFEGYRVFQYPTSEFKLSDANELATFDVKNGITQIRETDSDGLIQIVANGNDTGVAHSIQINNLTNYTEYYFGVQAYAYDASTDVNRAYPSPIRLVTVTPSKVDARDGGTVVSEDALAAAATSDADVEGVRVGKGGGSVSAKVVDPVSVKNATYSVNFYSATLPDAEAGKKAVKDTPEEANGKMWQRRKLTAPKALATDVTTYDVFRGTDKIFDGGTGNQGAITLTGAAAPQRGDVLLLDGLSFTIAGPDPAPLEIDPGDYAFVEVAGPDDSYACGPNAVSTFGCAEVGGNFLYPSFNGAGTYVMTSFGTGPEGTLGGFAPDDFEIRFTDEGSYAYWPFTSGNAIKVPFEVWDIGPTGIFGTNDPSDDVQMIPNVFSDNAGECEWAYGEAASPFFGSGTNGASDRIYAYHPVNNDYAAWEAAIKPIVDADPNNCPTSPATDDASNLIDFGRGRAIQRVVFDDATGDPAVTHPASGVVVRFYTTKPNLPGDTFSFSTDGLGSTTGNASVAKAAIEKIAIVPNPYKGASAYEVSNLNDVVRITNLPAQATIRVFSLSGTLIKTIEKRDPASTFVNWDLQTDDALPIASGMYLIHVTAKNASGKSIGEKVLKFGVIKKRIQLDVL